MRNISGRAMLTDSTVLIVNLNDAVKDILRLQTGSVLCSH